MIEVIPPLLQHPLGQCAGHAAEVIRCESYNFYSGIGSDASEITLIGAAVALIVGVWHHVNCGAPGCWRISKHHYTDKDGKHHQFCHTHDVEDHPKGPHWWSRRRGHELSTLHARVRGELRLPLVD